MPENKLYMAVGEEAVRGTGEVTTVGFIPLNGSNIPTSEFEDVRRKQFRGEDTVKGDTGVDRLSQKWSGTIEMDMYTEAGTTEGIVGTLFKHFFGASTTDGPNGSTAYGHMLYPAADPFAAANLDNDALTFSLNINEGTAMKNWPYVGGRVTTLSFEQESGEKLKVSADIMGQFKDTTTAELGSETFAAENLRCDYNNLKVYTGTITRTGSGPDYTAFTFGSATQLFPDSISVKIENGMEDNIRLSGVDYPDKTRLGQFKVTVELTLDWEDPAAGFSSVDDFNSWVAASSTTNFTLEWDTGTEAGTALNHKLVLDLPRVERKGGIPEYDLEKDPMITLTYEGLVDATTTYMVGCFLQNSASAI
jgi:hypothetical protein